MPTATSMAGLLDMISKEVKAAMEETNAKALTNMREETQGFYSIGNPVLYTRTGMLGNSPRTDPVSGGGLQYSFSFYLERPPYPESNPVFTSRGYASYFSPLQVLNAAEYHFAHVLGRPGFWHRAELKTERDFIRAFSSRFG